MISSISTCPKCNTLVLSDTVQCPSCHHVLLPDRVDETVIQDPKETPVEEEAADKSEIPCRECGVMVRRGVVRCWNCGAFQEQDIEARFFEMQELEPDVILSEVDEIELEEIKQQERADDAEEFDADEFVDDDEDFFSTDRQHGISDEEEAPEDDFELADEVNIYESTIDTTEAPEPAAATESVENESKESAETVPPEAADPAEEESDSESQTEEAKTEDADKPEEVAEKSADEFENLFNIAMREEAERESRLKRRQQEEKRQMAKVLRVKADGSVVVAPSCQCLAIVVQPEHFGKVMRCPKCSEKFRVPSPRPSAKVVKTKQEETAEQEEVKQQEQFLVVRDQAGEYQMWLEDLRMHVFNPEKTKPTAGAVEKRYYPVDIGFSYDHLLVASLMTKQGNVSRGDKKVAAVRDKMKGALKEEKPLAEQKEIAADEKSIGALAEFELIYPAPNSESAILEGQPIFGEGRIGVRVPKDVKEPEIACLSMTLSQYREFCRLLAEYYGYAAFMLGSTVPFVEQTHEVSCQSSKEKFEFLSNLEYYQADDRFDLQLIGWKCESCEAYMSEAAREESKLGGKGAKAIAKAKCPTCSQKMGSIQLFRIKPTDLPEEVQPSDAEETPEVAGAAAE